MKPIVFAHFGNSNYLPLALEIAKKFNLDTPIYLLGDEENKKYSSLGVIHKPYTDYKSGPLGEFVANFQYISNIEGELHKKIHFFCFVRWFMLYEFMLQEGIKGIWYFDSDIYVCRNLAERDNLFSNYEMALMNRICANVACINSQKVLKKYIGLCISSFQNKSFIKKQEQMVKNATKGYECCDMTIWGEYQKVFSELGEASRIIDGETFDHLLVTDRADQVEPETVWKMCNRGDARLKEITYKSDGPYCFYIPTQQLIRMNTLNTGRLNINIKRNIYEQLMRINP